MEQVLRHWRSSRSESIEALHVISSHRLLLGCDNNFPNTGRNPGRADDTELITVRIPG